MKISALTLLVFSLLLAAASTVLAGNQNVRFTVHNMSNNNDPSQGLIYSPAASNGWSTTSSRYFYSAQVDQVCIFCHTPHNARPANPLWNKYMPNNPVGFYKMYTSSRTLTPTARATKAPGPASLLCLSCHDGKTAVNVLHNAREYGTPAVGYDPGDRLIDIGGDPSPYTISQFGFGTKTAGNIGGTDADPAAGNVLNDDHPIGFSYPAAQSQSNSRLNDLATVNTKSGGKVRFFAPNNSIECSSCHDPHVNYDTNSAQPGNPTLRPFLAMSNANSALCLSCHNK